MPVRRGEMSQNDDFALVLETLSQADALVVAAPTYLLGANASLKRFLDRGLSFYAHLDRLWGKPAVGVAIAGIEGMEGCTKLNVESFIKLTLGDLRGSDVLYGALPGEIFIRPGGKETAKRLAEALTGSKEKVHPAAPACPVCGGDTFRFLPGGQVRCMLCSSSGAYVWQEGRLHLETKPGQHAFFLSIGSARRHADWLRGMKEEFLSRREELKAVTSNYTKIGTWVSRKGRNKNPSSLARPEVGEGVGLKDLNGILRVFTRQELLVEFRRVTIWLKYQ